MPHGIPLGQPDRYITANRIDDDVAERMFSSIDLAYAYLDLTMGGNDIGVHHRPKRNRYTIAGKPISRRTIDRLVYFGVIREADLDWGKYGSN